MSHTGIVLTPTAEVFTAPRRRGEPVRTLSSGFRLTVLERTQKWCTVSLSPDGPDDPGHAATGFVEAACLALVDPEGRGCLAADPALQQSVVEPEDGQALAPGRGAHEAAVARAWNLYGGLLANLSERIGIDPAYAVAVLCVESGGRGFGADGRVIIRFENHIFRRYLGAAGQATFSRHFQVGGQQPWLGHAFRESPSQPWTAFHGSQPLEWRAYEVARRLDEDAATRSISMGLPQVMGFNHGLIGYDSPRAMLAFMGADIRFQLLGLFDFVAGLDGRGPALAALRRGDFDGFATLYNGPGQARYYGDLIHTHVEAFRRLAPAHPAASGGRPPAASSTSSSASSSTSSSAGTTSPPGERRYEVRPGDTLSAIAGRFGVTLAAVVAANQIADPNRIFPGQVLVLPPPVPTPPPIVVPSVPPEDLVDDQEIPGHAYVVRPGDTLGAIARRAGTTVAALVAANGIRDPNLIFPGQVIRTPTAIS